MSSHLEYANLLRKWSIKVSTASLVRRQILKKSLMMAMLIRAIFNLTPIKWSAANSRFCKNRQPVLRWRVLLWPMTVFRCQNIKKPRNWACVNRGGTRSRYFRKFKCSFAQHVPVCARVKAYYYNDILQWLPWRSLKPSRLLFSLVCRPFFFPKCNTRRNNQRNSRSSTIVCSWTGLRNRCPVRPSFRP